MPRKTTTGKAHGGMTIGGVGGGVSWSQSEPRDTATAKKRVANKTKSP